MEEVTPLAAAPAASDGKVIEAVNMDELDDLDDEPGVPVQKEEEYSLVEKAMKMVVRKRHG